MEKFKEMINSRLINENHRQINGILREEAKELKKQVNLLSDKAEYYENKSNTLQELLIKEIEENREIKMLYERALKDYDELLQRNGEKMKVNYVLMYGTPYLKYKEFETFEDMSKFIVYRNIVDYSIFEKMQDKKEVEMIYRDNDIKYLEQENKELKERIDKAIECVEHERFKRNILLGIGESTYVKRMFEKIEEILKGDSNE